MIFRKAWCFALLMKTPSLCPDKHRKMISRQSSCPVLLLSTPPPLCSDQHKKVILSKSLCPALPLRTPSLCSDQRRKVILRGTSGCVDLEGQHPFAHVRQNDSTQMIELRWSCDVDLLRLLSCTHVGVGALAHSRLGVISDRRGCFPCTRASDAPAHIP